MICLNRTTSVIELPGKSASKYLFSLVFAILLAVGLPCYALQDSTYRSVADIPNPKDVDGGYVSDPQNLLTGYELDSLNNIIKELDKKTNVEAAVVIIKDFAPDQDDFTFATALFRRWGIGKLGANNGLLLFIATDRRQYRFISGYGVEGLLPDATLSKIGEEILVPAFKEQAYGRGIIGAMQTISEYLQQPANKKELNSLIARQTAQSSGITNRDILLIIAVLATIGAGWQISKFKSRYSKSKQKTANIYDDISGWSVLLLIGIVCIIGVLGFFFGKITDIFAAIPKAFPVIICMCIVAYFFFAHLAVLSKLRKYFKDDVNYFDAGAKFYKQAWWHALLSPILLIFIAVQIVQISRLKKRTKPQKDKKGNLMKRIDRDSAYNIEDYLSAGKQKEEETGSLTYDIWTGSDKKDLKLVANEGYHYDDFEVCPSCGFRTYTNPIEVIIDRPTYTHAGKAKRVRVCRNCQHEQFIAFIAVAMLVRSTSSSSTSGSGSSSSSGSGSDSSSSSGSWGGGSTGGGGAGGRW